MRASFTFTNDAPRARLLISGELDLSTGEELSAVLQQAASGGCTRLEVDLQECTFIDASTLAQLRHEQRRLRTADGDLLVVAASACYRLVCRLAQYHTLQPSDLGALTLPEQRTPVEVELHPTG